MNKRKTTRKIQRQRERENENAASHQQQQKNREVEGEKGGDILIPKQSPPAQSTTSLLRFFPFLCWLK